jgi:DNA adenine methylase
LSKILSNHSNENYYKIRSEFNNGASNIKHAAQLIYLNKTSFNGIYRVNQNGDYNVPFGFIEKPSIVDQKEIIEISNTLRSTEIEVAPFESSIKYASDNTFYYLDPPYPPLNETSFFTHYTTEKFNHSDHERVHDFATRLSEKDVKVLISNADVKFIRELYHDWDIIRTSTVRWVSCKNKKIKVSELIIKNY